MNVLNIKFYLRAKSNKKSFVPYMRVTINSMPSILRSLKTEVDPKQWEKGRGEVKGHSALAIELNSKIERSEAGYILKKSLKNWILKGTILLGSNYGKPLIRPIKNKIPAPPQLPNAFMITFSTK